jgi:hypothetical protein
VECINCERGAAIEPPAERPEGLAEWADEDGLQLWVCVEHNRALEDLATRIPEFPFRRGEVWAGSAILSRTGAVDVEYERVGTSNGRGIYESGSNTIEWSGTQWVVTDNEELGGVAYYSNENRASPWQVEVWNILPGALLDPVVTLGV